MITNTEISTLYFYELGNFFSKSEFFKVFNYVGIRTSLSYDTKLFKRNARPLKRKKILSRDKTLLFCCLL